MNTKFVNVVDLECTCWPDNNQPRSVIPGVTVADPAPMEIIEIGIAQIDVQLIYRTPIWSMKDKLTSLDKYIRRGQIYVTPIMGTVSEFCTKLTGIRQETVDNAGRTLDGALEILRKEWNCGSYPWVSWGDFDRIQFDRECRMKGIKYPFGPTHVNAKQLFAVKYGMNKGVGEGKALESLGWKFEGSPHCGADDAFNAARLFIKTMWG